MAEIISLSAKLLLEIRYQKIVGEGLDYSKLTDEEKYILDAQKEHNKRKNNVLAAILNGRTRVLESMSSKIFSKKVVIRFVKPMEQFVGMDMSKYGPFKEEDVAILPFENARSLIENGEAVEVDIFL